MNAALSFNEIFDLLINAGNDVTFLIEGEMGTGKSTLGKAVAKHLGYHFAYIDVANMALGDLTTPKPDVDAGCTRYLPNEVLQMHMGGPIVAMLDEYPKGTREAKNMLLPVALERRLGSTKFHQQSIVFATGNLAAEGVGDTLQAHQRNRFVVIEMAKPTAEEWINNFAVNNDIDPTVIAFADQYPKLFQSYKDDPNGENPYIYNPKKQSQRAVVTPRSLEFASDLVKGKEKYTGRALLSALTGAIGPAAAADLSAFVNMSEQLPPYASIVSDPLKTVLPKEMVNRLLLTYQLIMRVEAATIKPVVEYIERLPNEMQALFANKLLSTPSKNKWAAHCEPMKRLVMAKQHLFS